MAAHHQMAIEMAVVEQQQGTRPELKALAAMMIEAQRKMATVALRRSDLEQIRTLSRGIIDAQAEEIGKMMGWRKAWYGNQ